ncbi:MAG: hypothetical protein KGD60_15070, partial [Candidatus Thorarchaeota archaeon]|nr:hypothetical protein [Candidatus Thorarchaeota archaeon]
VLSFEMDDKVLTSGRRFCIHQNAPVILVADVPSDPVQHWVFSLVLQMPFFKHLLNNRTHLYINVAKP